MKTIIHEFKVTRKKLFSALALSFIIFLTACEGPQGVPGPQGPQGTALEAEVFELQNVNFALDANNEYIIRQTLDPKILASDNILIYRLSGTINPSTPIWQQIPRTLFLEQGELDYDFDFSMQDFTIYAGGTYNLALTPSYITGQTFRIVIIPGYFSNKGKNAARIDYNDYNAVAKAYNIVDSQVKILK